MLPDPIYGSTRLSSFMRPQTPAAVPAPAASTPGSPVPRNMFGLQRAPTRREVLDRSAESIQSNLEASTAARTAEVFTEGEKRTLDNVKDKIRQLQGQTSAIEKRNQILKQEIEVKIETQIAKQEARRQEGQRMAARLAEERKKQEQALQEEQELKAHVTAKTEELSRKTQEADQAFQKTMNVDKDIVAMVPEPQWTRLDDVSVTQLYSDGMTADTVAGSEVKFAIPDDVGTGEVSVYFPRSLKAKEEFTVIFKKEGSAATEAMPVV